MTPVIPARVGVRRKWDARLHTRRAARARPPGPRGASSADPPGRQVRAVREGRLFPLPNYFCSHYRQGEAVQS
ncbi:hypothetical protein [Actinomycetospora aeridis]|uniref:Uncharacterized protein n=1 Tax=Actinomycetospora aeridis TaxID=3129231 RepID=A0ABU8N8C0_9PSEU